MAAILVWGKGFRIGETTTPSGQPCQEVVCNEGDSTSIAWSSVEEMQALAEEHGVSKQIWPVYPDCDIEGNVPLEEAERRSAELRTVLERVDPRTLEGSYWLSFIWRLLREGNSFFIMV